MHTPHAGSGGQCGGSGGGGGQAASMLGGGAAGGGRVQEAAAKGPLPVPSTLSLPPPCLPTCSQMFIVARRAVSRLRAPTSSACASAMTSGRAACRRSPSTVSEAETYSFATW